MLQEPFRYGREGLIFTPDQIKDRLKSGFQGSEDQTASRQCVDELVEGQKIAQTFLYEHGSVVGKAEGTFLMKFFDAFAAPARQVVTPALVGNEER